MLDATRSNSALPKRVYRKLRAIRAMNDMHEAANEERAAAPPLTAEDADAQLSAQLSSAAIAAAMGFLTYRSTKSEEVLNRLRDEDHSPESNVGDALLLERVKAAMEERPEQERILLQRHYFEDKQLDDIAKDLGLSKSWTSRLHARAIEALVKSLRRSGID
jgi:RNA polymerase sigma factor FliA